jgi:hypothetical protein
MKNKKLLKQKIALLRAQIISERFGSVPYYLSGKQEDLINQMNRLKKQLRDLD